MYQEQPPVERTPIPEMTYKPKEGDIGAWDFQSKFAGGQVYSPPQFDFESLVKYYYQHEQGQLEISPQQKLINSLQNYGRR